MGFRFGSRRRREKQPENEKNEKPKREEKNRKSNDKSNARLPPVPGNLKSSESRNSSALSFAGGLKDASTNTLSTPNNRSVQFRDNRFPDGTTIPRVPTTQLHMTSPMAERDGRISPTGSIYSTASLQAPISSLYSYPSNYFPQTLSKHFDSIPRTRGRINSDGASRSLYGDALPKPDYPLSNDGTGNSNRDSGLDTESRSSSGEKPTYTNGFDSYPHPSNSPLQMRSQRSRHHSLDRSGPFNKLSEFPQILRPKGGQGNRVTSNFYSPGYSSSRPANHSYNDNYLTPATARRWANQIEDFEEETYRPRSTHQSLHCLSCSCAEDVVHPPRCTSALRRIQLEDQAPDERRWNTATTSRKRERRFRRDDEEEYSKRSVSRGLPRNQPVRGNFFEEREEIDRYGQLPPMRRPISTQPRRRNFYDDNDGSNDNDDIQEDEFDYSGEDGSDIQETSRTFVPRKRQSDFYEMNRDISLANRDTSVIRL
ncbi:unnamed protein product [Rodentolepis nana]|uniref:SH2 domain-containing protein n=1 Tax=Rodentolepis nana TaxID=102285 RepID=A0A0R3TPP8_RODNA|nr:unnamed protein product [Rodentolepis nana]